MIRNLERSHLPALARGFSLLGSGGGGRATIQELILDGASHWPISVHDVQDVDPNLPCVAPVYVGSTHFLVERLPGADPFGPLLKAAQRWSGKTAVAICAAEGAGMNGLTPLNLAAEHLLLDADFCGRAFPRLDQMSLYIDHVPGLFIVCDTGAGGVALVQSQRAEDIEKVVRAAVIQAGGVAPVLMGGFTVGDLLEHAINGTYQRALELGEAFESAVGEPLEVLIEAVGGSFLGQGRVTSVQGTSKGVHDASIEITGSDHQVLRLIAQSEFLGFMDNGEVLAATPQIIVVLDVLSREVLQTDEVTAGRDIAAFSLPAPEWFLRSEHRLEGIRPESFGLVGMDLR